MHTVKYVTNSNIDKKKWDEVISKAANGSIYAYSWYLDCMTEDWDALILGNYEYIMPLTWNKKYGIPYIHPVFFIQKLDIYSLTGQTSPQLFTRFFNAIPKRYRQIHMFLNFSVPFQYSGAKMQLKTNYILDINKPYTEIYENYRRDAKKKLKQHPNVYLYEPHNNIHQIVQMYVQNLAQQVPGIKQEHYNKLEKVAHIAQNNGHLLCRKISTHEGEILASALFFISHKTAYYLMGSQTNNGKKLLAGHYLLDCFFQENAQKLHWFDFEGSDVEGIADFFKKWGATKENYMMMKIKKFPLNLL